MIERTKYLEELKKLKDKRVIKVLTGIRRSGKSTILEQFQAHLLDVNVSADNIISINLDDADNNHLLNWNTLHDYVTSKVKNNDNKYYVFLDEIQMVEQFERCINSLLLRKNIDLYVTGSNSYILSGELATFLSGRYMEIHVLPLSFREYLTWYLTKYESKPDLLGTKVRKSREEIYNDYKEFGGFPYLTNFDQDETLMKKYLESVYTTVLMKDVVSRKKVKDTMMLDSIVRFLFDNIGSSVSTKKISDTLASHGRKNSVHTIEAYLQALLDSFVLYRVNRYDIKGKQFLKTQEKYYLSDLGLRTYLLGKSGGKDQGHILENIVFLELKRRGYKIFIGKHDTTEVDFVVEDHDNVKYIQVSLTVRDPETLERELRPLESIKDNYPKYLMTLDYDKDDFEGIKQISVIDFLSGKVDI